jgi:uncharacterized protein YcaQ
MQPVTLTPAQARKLALVSQGFAQPAASRGRRGALAAVERLGYVQIDTISVVARAHHHTLWNRAPGYRPEHLDALVAERAVLEYWAHAAAYLPMEDYRFCLPRMRAIASGQRHWYERDSKLMREILARFRDEGELRAADFDAHTASTGMWNWGPVKRALEQLFMEGEILVTRRDNFQKVFDLPERVLPEGIDTSQPAMDEYAGHLVDRYFDAHGIARAGDVGHLRKGMGPAIREAVTARIEAGALLPARVSGQDDLLVTTDFEMRLARRLPRSQVRLLSPFDNLVIQRDRLARLFGFDYQLECYVPAPKRRHGYFSLPVLWGDRLVARADCKADRATGVFHVHRLTAEPRLRDLDAFAHAAANALEEFAFFNGCRRVLVKRTEPPTLATMLLNALAA